jgi:hypothetical protein
MSFESVNLHSATYLGEPTLPCFSRAFGAELSRAALTDILRALGLPRLK